MVGAFTSGQRLGREETTQQATHDDGLPDSDTTDSRQRQTATDSRHQSAVRQQSATDKANNNSDSDSHYISSDGRDWARAFLAALYITRRQRRTSSDLTLPSVLELGTPAFRQRLCDPVHYTVHSTQYTVHSTQYTVCIYISSPPPRQLLSKESLHIGQLR
ncbi:hypothetical protein K504DRAFT_283971 [Pleomassaria siparia CBS 279.74]|uniref:Uncharacterized protein n=1 Tax=Pleomassaria siparia CBS 279.74 TaxID=1314801 RepID=A0A6G1KAE2_9PLEO|nr:hypothetical protein K504DRAFT_283971 [Pleomassaria siparia CBS 279.74]